MASPSRSSSTGWSSRSAWPSWPGCSCSTFSDLMMLKVDFTALGGIARKPNGLAVTLFVNWLVKPFSMAFLAWLFMQHIFRSDDAQGGFHRARRHRSQAQWPRRHALRQLAGQAVQHGLPGLAVHAAHFQI